jgi:hypothetical protein
MKIPLQVTITPVGKPDVYKSLDRAEKFIAQLLASETARELAKEFQVEVQSYAPSNPKKLYRALGLSQASDETHLFSCWEQEAGGRTRKVGVFDALAGRNGAAEYNGNIARDWKLSGGKTVEEDAGIHLLYRNGQFVKRLWIEAERKEG